MVKIPRLWCKTQFLRELDGLGMGCCTSKQNWMVTGYHPKATRTSEPTKKPNDWWLNHVTSPNFLAEIINNGWSSSDSININLFFFLVNFMVNFMVKSQCFEKKSGPKSVAQVAQMACSPQPFGCWRCLLWRGEWHFRSWKKLGILRDNHGILCLWICMELWYL